MKQQTVIVLVALCAAGAFSACERQKSMADVQKDTASAQQSAAEANAKEQQRAEEKLASASGEVRDEQKDAQHTGAVQAEQVADTQAEGAHKVALARCESLSGNPQKSCQKQADADYQAAKANAKQERASTDPKP